ncbi:cytochrome b5-related protein-like [Coccinella septempunctata]|uniref:cytochrome b5-related protein-like n=1 Tax=Coccinella septempunctata TaxID=41139 RepID=UPI001D086CB9|nr:cytochrome b5-related protein-like [Coccinella septempunctata]XP_044758460.1 cytochrome b5-related protein-like [Coccinella septempunctata]XP_044758461.1 cytochrome b5-related protein-like [Coccinella septempunctata]XP_044758462.1 cytochrome b5-related protein-like [Coccinella septempunctata]XP_044758463.1 cytochrome b5-related protein-like [Coccinella septempunctata]XP_044758464.1 cytochrome b5-related protein-like [Coccinella septempunctata]
MEVYKNFFPDVSKDLPRKSVKGLSQIGSSFGIKYPTNRDHPLHSGDIWLAGKRADEGAEGLWRIHDELYDLTDFIDQHPGGKEWLRMTKGTDITEAFETYHIQETAQKILPKYFERKAKSARNYPFTFHENGFYKTLKKRIRQEVGKIPSKFAKQSEIIADSLFLSYVLTAWLATYSFSFLLGSLSGVLLSYTSIAAHNFFHQRDNFRMYYFDFTMMSSREWRISHAISHHLYTNTISDMEISSIEPFFHWLPYKKHPLLKYLSWFYGPIVYVFLFLVSWVKTLISNISMNGEVPWTTFLPFSILVMQYLGTDQSLSRCILMFAWIITSASFHFGIVGVNAGHHHPMLFHDGDASRPKEEMDFGVFQMDAVSDRREINRSPFLVITHFGDHALHHLFPTIDHGKLKFLYPTFIKTCEEFGVEWRCSSQLEMVKGQYLQLTRDVNESQPKRLKKIEVVD